MRKLLLLACLFFAGMFLNAKTSSSVNTYQTPPKKIADLLDVPRAPRIRLSPDKAWLAVSNRGELPTIEELAREELRIGGMRIDPANFSSTRSRMALRDLSFIDIEKKTEIPVTGIQGDILEVQWSPNSRHVAFTVVAVDGISLWVAAPDQPVAKNLTGKIINAVRGRNIFSWTPDSSALVTSLVPTDPNRKRPQANLPVGPNIQKTSGEEAPARTYQDLLKNPNDEALFEYFLTTQAARVSLDGKVTRLGEPGMILSLEPSPNGDYLLAESIHRPFSYLVPYYRFPRRIEVWDMAGKLVHQLADLPLAENVPKGFDAEPTGPRSVSWRADVPATLVWAEAADGGNPNVEADVRDKVYTHAAPFTGGPQLLQDLEMRFGGVNWGNGDVALVTEFWWKTRQLRTWHIAPDKPSVTSKILVERSFNDRYADPGNPVTYTSAQGTEVLLLTDGGKSLLLRGDGASPKGNIPFLDKMNLKNGAKKRLWHSEAPYYEQVLDVLDKAGKRMITVRESPTDVPNLYLREKGKKEPVALTNRPHPTPELVGVHKELIRYKRDDGVDLTATLYLPPGWKEGDTPPPMVMWAYPREFKSADVAGQVRDSPYRFVNISFWGPLPFLTQGYAVLEGPTMPIIGEGDTEPNDTYRRQLVSSASAAIDEVVRRGVADRDRIAIGGHSYGAFMVANLMAHSDLFRAGIARSGAYNRSLTPFGFQAEERTFWEAQDTYSQMSPFFHAEKINEPILFIHGENDNNSGTFPMQSRRMFQAVKGLGGTARLVMLPYESHGYRARESLLHMLWEEYQWLEQYVKPAKKAEPPKNPS